MRSIAVALLVAALGLVLVAAESDATAGTATGGLFDYDPLSPLDIVYGPAVTGKGIVRQELSYQATGSLRLKALFVHPAAGGPWPIVIWSPGAGGDWRQELPEAATLAHGGAASLLVDEAPLAACNNPQRGLDMQISYVISRRRAVDLVETLENVDAKRIAAAGFSRGASVTAALAGVESRIHVFALKSGRGHFTGYIPIFCDQLTPAELRAAVTVEGVIDPVRWLKKATGATILLQNGTKDDLSPRADVLALYAAAKKPKELRWYPTGHDLNAAATAYRDTWLLQHLHAR